MQSRNRTFPVVPEGLAPGTFATLTTVSKPFPFATVIAERRTTGSGTRRTLRGLSAKNLFATQIRTRG